MTTQNNKQTIMKNFISLCMAALVLTVLFTSCNSTNRNNDNTATTQQSSTTDVDGLLAKAGELVGKEVEVEGICTHICKHGGRKIFLMGSDDKQTIRIEAGDVKRFDQKCVNSIVRVKGTLVEERIDEAYLQKWEATVAAQTTEKHGDGEAGCSTEKKARGETANSTEARIRQFRERIAARKEKEGKEYLSFYHIAAINYTVQE